MSRLGSLPLKRLSVGEGGTMEDVDVDRNITKCGEARSRLSWMTILIKDHRSTDHRIQ